MKHWRRADMELDGTDPKSNARPLKRTTIRRKKQQDT
jgi:hypothetical protein